MLMSLDTIKHMISDYILYRDTDRQITRKCERLLNGLVELKTHLYDYILKVNPIVVYLYRYSLTKHNMKIEVKLLSLLHIFTIFPVLFI